MGARADARLGAGPTLHLITASCTVCGPEPLGRPANLGRVEVRRRRGGHRLGCTALALALYVGVEAVFSGWSAVIVADRLTLDAQRAALGTSVFWTLMATGRLAAWWVFRTRLARPHHLVVTAVAAGGFLALAGTGGGGPAAGVVPLGLAVILLGPCSSMILGLILILILGLGLGLAEVDAAVVERVTGALVACGATGGAAVPFLALAAGQTAASPALTSGCAVLLLLVAGLVRSAGHSVGRSAVSPRSNAGPGQGE